MKKVLRILASTLMLLMILASIFWYLCIYDREFTRDTLLSQARFQDTHGNSKLSAFFYDSAYVFSDQDEDVAIELANQYKQDGNYTKAELTLTTALNNNPTADLYVALSRAYVEQDKLLDAVNLLNNISDPAMKAQMDALRPTVPNADYAAGYYSQYMDLHLSSSGKYIFYSTDGSYPSTEGLVYQNKIALDTGETTIYAVSVDEHGLVSPVTALTYTITGIIEPVQFADPAMEAAIRQLVGADSDDVVYTNALWAITDFTAPEGVATFADLAQMPYLNRLTIQNQAIDSLTHLSTLTNLSILDLTGCSFDVEELPTVASLPYLRQLTLANCNLSTIAGLTNAPSLTHLDLSNNTVRHLDALTPMTNLQSLILDHNAVEDLRALSTLSALETLKVSYNPISSLAPLSNCAKLRTLEAEHGQLTTLDGIAGLPLLEALAVDYNSISDVSILSGCAELKNLSIASNGLSDITSLGGLNKLEIFDFSGNQVAELPDFASDCALQTIDGSYNVLTDLDELEGLGSLTHVFMDYNLLTNIDCLADNFCLVQVNAYGNAIPDVDALRDHDIIVNYDPTAANE